MKDDTITKIDPFKGDLKEELQKATKEVIRLRTKKLLTWTSIAETLVDFDTVPRADAAPAFRDSLRPTNL